MFKVEHVLHPVKEWMVLLDLRLFLDEEIKKKVNLVKQR